MRLLKLRSGLLPLLASLLLASCQGQSSSETASTTKETDAATADTASVTAPADGITATLIGQHIKALASDEFQGRRPFTAGEEKTPTIWPASSGSWACSPAPMAAISRRCRWSR